MSPLNILNLYGGIDFVSNSTSLAKKLDLKVIYTVNTSTKFKKLRLVRDNETDVFLYPAVLIPRLYRRSSEIYNNFTLDDLNSLKLLIYRYRNYITLFGDKINYENYAQYYINYGYSILSEAEIDFVVLDGIPHTPLNFVILKLTNILNIKTMFVNDFLSLAGMKHKIFITENFQKLDDKQLLLFNKTVHNGYVSNSESTLKKEWNVLYNRFNNEINPTPVYLKSSKPLTRRKIKLPLFKVLLNFDRMFIRFNLSLRNMSAKKTYIATIKYLESIETDLVDLASEFVYVALHFQPEATTIPLGGDYADQLKLVTTVREKIPHSIPIYVKEHPAYWHDKNYTGFNDYRNKKFYKKISELPNSFLVKHAFPQDQLIKNASLICTVSGSITLEALSINKRVLLFSEHYYKYLPNVHLVDGFTYGDVKKKSLPKESFRNTLLFFQSICYDVSHTYSDGKIPQRSSEMDLILIDVIAMHIKEYYSK